MRRVLFAVIAVVAILLAGCGSPGGGDYEHQPRNSDPQALRSKLNALMADECFTADPAAVYPRCGKFYTELVGTENAIKDVLPGKPAAATKASGQIDAGMTQYAKNNCGPMDQQPKPELTQPCAAALNATRTGMQGVYDALYPPAK
jgi:hypothetical protein